MSPHSSISKSFSEAEEKSSLLDIEDRRPSDVDSQSSMSDLESGLKPRSSSAPYSTLAFAPFAYLRSTPWRPLIIRIVIFLTPSFLQGRQAREQIRPAKLSPTAYLDGMRGLAALFVYFCHYSYQAFTIAEGWGFRETNWAMLKLPFIRLWYQGPPAVCVFFVISGYALSYRPLKLVRSHSTSEFSTTMSSLIFRRGIRLYLPTIISTFMIVCLLRIGAYEWTREFADDKRYMKNIVEPHPKRMESALAQYMDWSWHMFNFVHVFGWEKFGGSTSYDVHLWTIPVEFRCSLYLFLVLLGTARLKTKLRFLVVASVMWFTYRNSRWELLLFFCGMILAEVDLIRGAHVTGSSSVSGERHHTPTKRWKPLFWTMVSIVGLYLMCQPDAGGEETPGWVYLSSLIPEWWDVEKYRYWQSAGAVVFTVAVGHSRGWQWFFNTGVVQYFGKISYALYLMHGPAMHCMGYHWEKWAYSITGLEGYQYNAGFLLGACFAVPTVVWWADIFWRAVDIPTVRFAKWIESKCIASE